MAGYKTEQFVDKIDANLLCPICKDVLKDPLICKEGHSFCRYCIAQWLRSVDRCPLDNILIEDKNLSRNLPLRGIIENLKVYCHPQGEDENLESTSVSLDAAQKCSWVGNLQNLAKHQMTCPFQLVPCAHQNCIAKMERRQIKEHEDMCKYKRVACDAKCGLELVRHELENHKASECPETLIPCPYECTSLEGIIQAIKRMDLDDHLANACGRALVDCPFKDQGCSVQVERQHVDKHVQDNMAAHMMLLDEQNTLLKVELNEVKRLRRHTSFGSYLWKIYDYHSLSRTKEKGTSFTSPMFIQCGHRWMMEVFPNGSSTSGFGMIVVRLFWIGDEEGNQYQDYKLSATVRLEAVNVKEESKSHFVTKNVIFNKTNDYWEWDRFMRSNTALSRNFCDTSTGILKIQCQIQLKDPD